MKTLRVSDDAHEKLTALLGELTAQKKMMQTYTDAIEALLSRSVILPPRLLEEVENFIKENRVYGYTTREEFIRDAIRRRLDDFNEDVESILIDRKKYELLNEAVKEMTIPYANGVEFIMEQIDRLLEEYEKFKEEQEEMEKKYEEEW